MSWNWVDVIVLVVLLRGAYVGRRDGLSVELVKLGTVFITYYCAIKYYVRLAVWISHHSRLPMEWATVIAFLSIAVESLVVVWIFFRLLGKVVTLQFESRISTGGGTVVGLVRGLLLSSLLFFGLFFIPDPFVRKQIYANAWWGRIAIDTTPPLYAKLANIVEEAHPSSEAITAQFAKEKKRMARMLQESSAKRTQAPTRAAGAPYQPAAAQQAQSASDMIRAQTQQDQATIEDLAKGQDKR